MKWPWRRPEVRSANYTEQVVSRLHAAASAKGDGGALGAIETAARWWGAGLGSARVTPASTALASVTPGVLDTVGRSLCRFGESLFVIDVRNGRVSLTPCGAWTISGSDDPGSWEYLCTLSGPTSTRTVTRQAASVLHFMYSPDPTRPWIGRSPMAMALATARVAGLLETATAGELNFTQQQVLTPRRGGGRLRADRHAHAGHRRQDRHRCSCTHRNRRFHDTRRRDGAAIRAGTPPELRGAS